MKNFDDLRKLEHSENDDVTVNREETAISFYNWSCKRKRREYRFRAGAELRNKQRGRVGVIASNVQND
jgi:hypothetical protein